MKKLIIPLIFCGLIYLLSTSCEEMFGHYLDKAPGVDVTEDTIFSNRIESETMLMSIYDYGIPSIFPYGVEAANATNRDEALLAGATDEAEICANWYAPNRWNAGTITATSTDDTRSEYRWVALRKITIYLARIGEVPDVDADYIAQVTAEVKFIRAINYFDMISRYGGVPIVKDRLGLNDDFFIKRGTLQETMDFILEDLNEAISVLPNTYPSNQFGKPTKGAALALKSRLLLYMASPLFNTGTPYIDNGENNDLICFGNYDVARWQAAADAAKAVIDWAPSGGIRLINDLGVDKNYKYVWEIYDNPEVIMYEKSNNGINFRKWPFCSISAPSIYNGSSGQSGTTVTLNFVKLYEKRSDGTAQTWDMNGGSDLQAKMLELDYRFRQTIAYNRSYWNWQFPLVQLHQGGRDEPTCKGGFWLHKHFPEAISTTQNTTWITQAPIVGLAEQYLNYAEALNEAQGPVAAAYTAVNTIRQRSGMPDLPAGLTQDQFRERVRNERAIELAFDGHRFWDVRRWLIAEQDGILNGDMWGIKIYEIPGVSPTEYRYVPYVFETRTFLKQHYLMPFNQSEVNKGYIIQNPGY